MKIHNTLVVILLLSVIQPCAGMQYVQSGTKKISKVCAWIGATLGLAYIAYYFTEREGLKSLCACINPWNRDIHEQVVETKTAVRNAHDELRTGQNVLGQTIITTGNQLGHKIANVNHAVTQSSALAEQAARAIQDDMAQNTQLGHANFALGLTTFNASQIAAYTGMANASKLNGMETHFRRLEAKFDLMQRENKNGHQETQNILMHLLQVHQVNILPKSID